MSNELPPGFSALIDLAKDMIGGLHDHGATIGEPPNQGIKQWTEAALTTRRDTALAAKLAHTAACNAENDVTSVRKVANAHAKDFIATARRMLLDELGASPNKAWEAAGWPPGSTAAPDTIDARKTLLDKLIPWLGDHPDKEVAQKNFTAAEGRQILDALAAAMNGLTGKVGDREKAAAADEAAEAALRTGMSGLAREIGSLLPDDSPDWYYFGLVPPGKADPPAVPDLVDIQTAGSGKVLLGCARSARATSYRFAILLDGRDHDWVELDLHRDPEFLVSDLPVGGRLHARVQAHNAAGDSPWSQEVAATVL